MNRAVHDIYRRILICDDFDGGKEERKNQRLVCVVSVYEKESKAKIKAMK